MSEHRLHDAPPLPPDLQAWLDERPPEERAELRRTWALVGLAREAEPTTVEAGPAWETVAGALDEENERAASPQAPPPSAPRGETRRRAEALASRRAAHESSRRRTRPWLRRAAVATVVMLLVGAAFYWRLRPVTMRAPAGEEALVELPDGSTAVLNGDSRLTYRRGIFGWGGFLQSARAVRLRGEAFFDVVEAEERFTVRTTNAQVQVFGTRFNVRARPVRGQHGDTTATIPVTSVVLTRGRVRLAAKGAPRRPVTLAPGQMSRVVGTAAAPTTPAPADVEATTAWRRGGFAFTGAPLGEIVREVERRFGVEVRVDSPALWRDSVSLYLPHATDAASVLRDLCGYRGDCTVRRTPEGLVLDAPARR